ncbi:diguanylate cyclase [Thalassoroseus pseudoceratinae]|uniref:diguanylate cyclase n=1 Tax=Thalassoroseus pseudoceratinae TaxID=2713176 RepID=UPI00141F4F2B|nr:diguanylate cyclase [Thalassoroseus pseudoceratinae]
MPNDLLSHEATSTKNQPRPQSAQSAELVATIAERRFSGRNVAESSRTLLSLLALSEAAESLENPDESDTLHDVIQRGALRSLLAALHARDEGTVNHSRRVALLAVGLAERLGWDGTQLKRLEVAALLHDVGKIGVPDHILFKPGQLSSDETELMALHYDVGVDVLQACRVDQKVLDIVVQSHLYFKSGNTSSDVVDSEVSQGARILAVADAYDSLQTPQVYRPAKTHDEIMQHLMDSAGTRFDGNVVCALARWLKEEGLPFDCVPSTSDSGTSSLSDSMKVFQTNSLFKIFSYLYVMESLYDGFALIDSNLRYAIWNRGIERLSGYSAQSFLGRTWSGKLIEYADRENQVIPEKRCPVWQVMESGIPQTDLFRIRHKHGEWVDTEIQTVPLIDESGSFQGVAQIYRDVSRTTRRPQEFHELKMAATRDALTSVANRGELETQLTLLVNQWSQARVSDNENEVPVFSLLFLDIDHFKSVNDNYGHAAGDAVLVQTAKMLQNETYSGELVGRYGGEEFVVICPDTNLKQARQRAERLRLAISRLRFKGHNKLTVTSSFGAAEIEPGDSVESLLRRADKALYQSKESGRNRTTTLTNEQFIGADHTPQAEEQGGDPFLVESSFAVAGSADLIVCKLGGLVNDDQAVVLKTSHDEAVFRMGTKSLFGGWGKTPDRQPVRIVVKLIRPDARNREVRKRIQLHISICPIGRVKSAEVFQNRAHQALRAIRGYLVVD